MPWNKYKVEKKQIYQNGGWVDTYPLQTREGGMIGTFDTYSDCVNNHSGYTSDYLTFVALESGKFAFRPTNSDSTTLQYSLDNGRTWTSLGVGDLAFNLGDSTPMISAGQKVIWKGNINALSEYCTDVDICNGVGYFQSTGRFDVEGNIMSLLNNGVDFDQNLTITRKRQFKSILYRTHVVSAENLILPATAITEGCYYQLFRECVELETGPAILPAMELKMFCYSGMFKDCDNLTKAPVLPATSLPNDISDECYTFMFDGCTELHYIKMMQSENPQHCSNYSDWSRDLPNSGTLVINANAQWINNSTLVNCIVPTGWTIQTASS